MKMNTPAQKKLAKALNQDKKTQAEIAALIGVARPTVSKWLNGKNISSVPGHTTNIPKKKASPYDGRRKITGAQKDVIFEMAA